MANNLNFSQTYIPSRQDGLVGSILINVRIWSLIPGTASAMLQAFKTKQLDAPQ